MRPAWLVLLAAVLTGCRAGPPVAPTPSQPTAVRLLAEPLPPPRPIAAPESPASAPLTLEDAVASALAGNPRLRVLAAQADAALAGQDVAFAPFLPHVEFLARYSAFSTRSLPSGNFVAGTLSGGSYTFALEELGLQQTLLDFGRRSGRYDEAEARADVARLAVTRGRQTVAFEAAANWFRLLAARADREVWRQAVKRGEAVVEDTRARKEAGDARRADLLRAEVGLAEARTGLTAAEDAVFAAVARLNATLGRPAPAALEPADVPTPAADFDAVLDDCLNRAASGRPELLSAARDAAGAAAGERAARAEFCPRIYFQTGLFRVDGIDRLHTWVDGAGVHLQQTLYAGGRLRAEVRGAEARVREAAARMRVVFDQVALEVSLAWSAVGTARERLRLAETAVRSADEYARLTEVRYRNGDATPTDVVDAQTALTRALTGRNTALYDTCIALAQLDYAVGTPTAGTPP